MGEIRDKRPGRPANAVIALTESIISVSFAARSPFSRCTALWLDTRAAAAQNPTRSKQDIVDLRFPVSLWNAEGLVRAFGVAAGFGSAERRMPIAALCSEAT
jgi:hypothetical protein